MLHIEFDVTGFTEVSASGDRPKIRILSDGASRHLPHGGHIDLYFQEIQHLDDLVDKLKVAAEEYRKWFTLTRCGPSSEG